LNAKKTIPVILPILADKYMQLIGKNNKNRYLLPLLRKPEKTNARQK